MADDAGAKISAVAEFALLQAGARIGHAEFLAEIDELLRLAAGDRCSPPPRPVAIQMVRQ